MDLLHDYQLISSLILKERLGVLQSDEADELLKWLAGHPRHRELYERLKRKDLVSALADYREIDAEKGLAKYRRRYVRRSIGAWKVAVAAIAVLFIGMTVLFLPMREDSPVAEKGIVPGMSKAELVLSDGSVWALENAAQEERVLSEHAVACNSGTRLSYKQIAESSAFRDDLPEHNELRVPTGGEYQLILSDGTKVWLNSQSRLKFPVVFRNGVREVELTGEAYFEVAPDKTSPFRIRLRDDVRVEVLGTSFNVRDYPDEETLETVLEKGCVRLVKGEHAVRLIPGMKGTYADKFGDLRTDLVDTEPYTSWRNGHFVFQNERLETILHKLSRWYEIQVVFRDEEVKDILFSGNVKKYDTIEKLLEAMETAGGVRFEVRGNTITVEGRK